MSEPNISPTAKPARSALFLGGGLLSVILITFILGKLGLLPSFETLSSFMSSTADSPYGLPALILVFCLAAFLGVPQFALIAMSIALFGPWLGFAYAWVANLTSGTVTFWTGRLAGEKAFRRYAGKTANKLSGFVGRNAFVTSAIVRNVPAGPFLLVNMAFGVSQAKFTHFLAGMAIGGLPKIILLAFAGQSVMSAIKGNPLVAIAMALLAVVIYFSIALYSRSRTAQPPPTVPLIEGEAVDTAPRDEE
ncbi:MAG: TVP38/TMEM64 family protein [Hyphomonas sp.]